jgi:RNA polymerase sigma-70 factor (sigma-E family)
MAVRAPGLRRKAYLLCGDWHAADDLAQEVLVTVYSRWSRVATGNVDAYANRVLFGKHVDALRRPWRRERSVAEHPDAVDSTAQQAFDVVDSRDAVLLGALRALTEDQRAVVVLRFVDDLTIDEIGHALDVPAGTVKSRLARALDTLRAVLGDHVSVPATELEDLS